MRMYGHCSVCVVDGSIVSVRLQLFVFFTVKLGIISHLQGVRLSGLSIMPLSWVYMFYVTCSTPSALHAGNCGVFAACDEDPP